MLILLEIGLIIAAWKRGWKGWALLPLAIQFLAIVLARTAIAAAGWSQPTPGVIGSVSDALLIGALAVMTVKSRRTKVSADEAGSLAAADHEYDSAVVWRNTSERR
jgi:hypothetical protein